MTRLDRPEPELNVAKGELDTTSPEAMCDDVVRILRTDRLSEKSLELLQSWLLKSETGAALIRAGVPKEWRVGDKTGRSGEGETNDVAVLYPPNGARVFVAIYSVAPSASDEKQSEIVARTAREVVDALSAAPKN